MFNVLPHGIPNKCNILYINCDFPPISGPGIWRALWFTRYLSEAGFKTTVLCSDKSNWCERKDLTLLNLILPGIKVQRINNILLLDIIEKINSFFIIQKFPIFMKIMNGLKWRIKKYCRYPYLFWFLKATIFSIIFVLKNKSTCIISSGPPHVSHICGWIASKFGDTIRIMDFRDLWTDDPYQSPQSGYQRKLFIILENKMIRSAKAFVTVSPTWRNYFRDKFADLKDKEKYHLIRNGHNIEDSVFEISSPRNVASKLHIHCSGTPQANSKTNALLESLCNLRKKGIPEEQFPLFTFTGIEDDMKEETIIRNLEGCIQDVSFIPFKESIEYSFKSDVLLIMVNNSFYLQRGTIPAKTYEAMALGRHILAIVPKESDVKELLMQYGNATICDVDDIDDISNKLIDIIKKYQDGELDRKNDESKRYNNFYKYSRKYQANKLIDLINSLQRNNISK